MDVGEVAHVEDLVAARGRDAGLLEEDPDRLVGVGEAGVVGADDAAGIGDADRCAFVLPGADDVLGGGLALRVGGRAGLDRHVDVDRAAARREEDRAARHVDDPRDAALHRAADHQLDAPRVRLEHLLRHRAPHIDERRAVVDGVAAGHRAIDRLGVRDVADDDVLVGDLEALRREDATGLLGVADQQPHPVAGLEEAAGGVRAREARAPRHHHAHRSTILPAAASPARGIYRDG